MLLFALFRLAFASAPRLYRLTSQHNVTRRPVLQKVRHHARVALCLLVSTRFQVLFHSPPGVLFTFPSRYYSTIGPRLVFRLGGWAPRLHTKFLVLGATLVLPGYDLHFVYGTFTLFGVPFQTSSTIHIMCPLAVRNPDSKLPVWPLSRSLAAT